MRTASGIHLLALLALAGGSLQADNLAYEVTSTELFGSIDLNTGVFTSIANQGVLLAGLGVAGGQLYGGVSGGDTLYRINPVTGGLTTVGTGTLSYFDFGSTTGGLFALDSSLNLYSVNAATGATTLIGSTGVTIQNGLDTIGLSTNSGTLYLTEGARLFTVDTTSGAATLVGNTGVEQFGALVFEAGQLWGGGNQPAKGVFTLDTTTGAATPVAVATTTFYGLAPEPLPGTASVPEPQSWLLLVTAAAVLAFFRYRTRTV